MISARHWHKTVCLLMALLLICMLAGCTQKQKEEEPIPSEQPSQTNEETETPDTQEETEKMLKLYIDEQEITVTWENNESVMALFELAEKGSVNITTSRYGGFEQVGPIGQSLPRHDVHTETGPGDIVLYSGNQIVVFYGTNSWSYTKLGHIENMSNQELTQLLNKNNVSLRLSIEQ